MSRWQRDLQDIVAEATRGVFGDGGPPYGGALTAIVAPENRYAGVGKREDSGRRAADETRRRLEETEGEMARLRTDWDRKKWELDMEKERNQWAKRLEEAQVRMNLL